MMAIQTLYSAKRIEQQFHTGEEPVMYFTDLRFVAGSYLGEAQYAKNRASLKAMIR
jgi:hypothetical protein